MTAHARPGRTALAFLYQTVWLNGVVAAIGMAIGLVVGVPLLVILKLLDLRRWPWMA